MGTFKVAHKNYIKFYSNNEWNEELARDTIKGYYIEERLEYIHRFYECLLNSEKMNELGLLYIKHSSSSVREVVEEYNRDKSSNQKINENTGKSRIIACANKVNNSFEVIKYSGDGNASEKEPLEWIITKGTVTDNNTKLKEVYENSKIQIDNFIEMFDTTNKQKKEQLIIKLPACAKVRELPDEKFDILLEVIRPYSKKQISYVERLLSNMKDSVGYYNYLMTPGMKLTEQDKERRAILLSWLGLNEDSKESNSVINNNTDDSLDDFDL